MYYLTPAVPIAFAAVVAFFCCSFDVVFGEEQQKVNIDVYYESKCPDSMYFITKQLTPAYNGGLKDYLSISFVPFGKASWWTEDETNKVLYSCQHGAEECEGNKAHACALYEIENTVRPEDQQQKMVDIVNCAMASSNPAIAVPQCARNQQFSEEFVQSVVNCSKSNLGDDLFIQHGKKTKSFESPLRFVPSIAIKGKNEPKAFRNFIGTVCQEIPDSDQLSICRQ